MQFDKPIPYKYVSTVLKGDGNPDCGTGLPYNPQIRKYPVTIIISLTYQQFI
jgi:hypothetical protein